MSDGEWERFFDLLRKASDVPDLSWMEKRTEMTRQAQRHGAGDALEEVMSWYETDDSKGEEPE